MRCALILFARLAFAAMAIASFSSSADSARAGPASECDNALVKYVYKDTGATHEDWRIATLVTQTSWSELHSQFGASGIVSGIPLGASYDEFQKNVSSYLKSYNESRIRDEAHDITLSKLDPVAVSAYQSCLNAELNALDGLHMRISSATKNDITVLVRWYTPSGPPEISLKWSYPKVGGKNLDATAHQGLTPITIPRPDKELTLNASHGGFATENVVVGPYPVDRPLPFHGFDWPLPDDGAASACDTNDLIPANQKICLYVNGSWNGDGNPGVGPLHPTYRTSVYIMNAATGQKMVDKRETYQHPSVFVAADPFYVCVEPPALSNRKNNPSDVPKATALPFGGAPSCPKK